MTARPAVFFPVEDVFIPHDKNAVAICAILSRMRLRLDHMILVRAHGFVPLLEDGTEIGKVEVTA